MKNDDFNQDGMSSNNQNLMNYVEDSPVPQEPETVNVNPVMDEKVVGNGAVESSEFVTTNVSAQSDESRSSQNHTYDSDYIVQPSSIDTMASTTIQPTITQTNTPSPTNETVSKNGNKNKILIAIIVLLIMAIAGIYVYLNFFGNISHKVYQSAVEKGIGTLFDSIHNDNAFQYDVSLDANLNANNDVIPKEISELINKVRLASTIQIDKNNQRAIIKFDTTHDSEVLLKADVFAELNNSKAYVMLPSLFDKYIETDKVDFSKLTKTLEKKYDYKTIEKVLKREIIKIIKEEECTNENGYYIWKTNSKEFLKRVINLVGTLKTDSEFVNALGGKEEVDQIFGNGFVTADDITESYEMVFKINNNSYDVTIGAININGTIGDDTVTFDLKSPNTSLFSGSITIKKINDSKTINLSLSSSLFGTIKVNMSTKYSKISSIDDIDKSKIVKIEDITPEESQELMQKFQESKLYQIISNFIPQSMNDDILDINEADIDFEM